MCQEHLVEVYKRCDDIRKVGGEVVVISFESPERLRAHLEIHPSPFPVLADPERAAYRAFGLGRGSFLRVAGLPTLWTYLRLLLRGRRLRLPQAGSDIYQLGGDFVLDRANRVTYSYPSRRSNDRPSAEAVVRAVQAAAGEAGR